ncbi:prepilin-type N-terminal cleavage/methylation domain-containing protein [Desulfobulbus sp.]|uniref:type IV pilus modification PilV family protein n=1 Tax=Desulfobulbus sp. TaxID=895 RepID=UPI00286F52F5|nr:prepilin-type N-terminal cleavage/methylation domain-containing protein [Desulfobulbus sp.]
MPPRRHKPCSNEPGTAPGRFSPGFTLLEVMIAVALIAIALVTLIGAQARSVAIATGSQFDAMASMLAQWKLAELSLQDFEQLTGTSGDFGEAYPHFSWKAEVETVNEGDIGIKGSGEMLKTIDVTILVEGDAARSYTARTMVFKQQQGKADAGKAGTGTDKAKAAAGKETGTDGIRDSGPHTER